MNITDELRNLCQSYSMNLKEFPGGHFRVSNHGSSVDYWPTSKKMTARKDGVNTYHCSPFDVIQICLQGSKVSINRKRGPVGKKAPPKNIEPIRNEGVLKHFDTREIPWEGERWMAESDKLRWEAWLLENKVIELRAIADSMDDEESEIAVAARIDVEHIGNLREQGLQL